MKRRWRREVTRRQHALKRRDDEAGVSLVEVIAAMVILTITFTSLASVVLRSVSVGHLAQQREAAASIVSDVIENGRALGLSCLTAASAAVSPPTAAMIAACPTVLQTPGTLSGTWTGLQPPATSFVQSAAFFTPAAVTSDATVYTLIITLATSTSELSVEAVWPGSDYTASAVVGY